MENKERVYDYTTLDTFLQCRRKYYWMMVRHLRSKTVAPALSFGQAIHEALAEYYRSGLNQSLEKFRATYQDREGEELRTVANGIKLLEGYNRVYHNEPFKIVQIDGKPAIEIGFVVPIGNMMYAGRIDALVEWGSDLLVLEHKTAGRLDSNYFKQYNPNMQIDGYIYGAEAYAGRKCFGAVVNALEVWKELKRPTEKSKKLEDHYARNPENRNPEQLAEFARQVQMIVKDIEECEENSACDGGMNAFYQNKHQCRSYNFDCPYKQLCMFGENERIIEHDYVVEKWEPYKEGEGGME